MRGSATFAILLAACGGARPPKSVLDADAARHSPAVRAAHEDAPDAVAEAERVLAKAHAADRDGRREEAARLGAEAAARFDFAILEARAAVAERRIAQAERRITDAEQERERHETGRAAEERRIEVLRHEAETRRVLEEERARAASEEGARSKRLPAAEQRLREEAMRVAAGEARVRARMICLAGRTLAEDAAAFDAAIAPKREAAERAGRGNDARADLDAGLAYRDACVRALETVRAATRSTAADRTEVEGAVFEAAVAAGGLDPRRDERGVVLTLHGAFARGSTIAAPGRAAIEKIAGLVKTRSIRLVVEGHGGSDAASTARANAIADAIGAAGVDRARIAAAGFGGTRPLLPAPRGRADQRDERVEIVVVAGGE